MSNTDSTPDINMAVRENSAQEAPSARKWTFTNAFIIAAAAPYGYALAYSYQLGRAAYFKIPSELVSVSIENAFIAAGAVLGIAYAVYSVLNTALVLLPQSWRPLVRESAIPVIFALGGLFAGDFIIRLIWPSLVFPAVMLAVDYGIPALPPREESYAERLRKSRQSEKRVHEKSLMPVIGAVANPNTILLAVGFIVVLFYAFINGQANAARQREFAVTRIDPGLIELARYNDVVVLGRMASDHRALDPVFIVYRLGQEPAYAAFTVQAIGPFPETVIPTNASSSSAHPDTPG